MPVYQYHCNSCGGDLEARQSFTDAALTDCTECGQAGSLRKVFNSVGVVFKGSGFYRNDARSQSTVGAQRNPNKDNNESKSSSSESSKTETTKTDSTKSSSESTKKTSSEKSTATAAAAK